MKKGRKSSFNLYLRNFVLMLVIPMLTVFLVFMYSRNLVKEITVDYSEKLLNQFFLRIDAVVENAWEVCELIGNSEESRQYALYAVDYPDKIGYKTYAIREKIDEYRAGNHQDVFVYFTGNKKVISAVNGSSAVDNYYEMVYGGAFAEEFNCMLDEATVRPQIRRIVDRDGDSYICVTARQNAYHDEKYDFVVVVVLKHYLLSDLLIELEGKKTQNDFLLFDENWSLMHSAEELNEWSGLELDDSALQDVKVGENEYLILSKSSQIVKAYYGYAVAKGYFWERLDHLYLICSIGAVISLLLGVFLAFHRAHRIYRPMGEIVNKIQKTDSIVYDAKEDTEFEFIEELFRKKTLENAELSREAQKGKVAERVALLRNLLKGNGEQYILKEGVLSQTGIHFVPGGFQVALIRVEDGGQFDAPLLGFVIQNVFEELANRTHIGYVVSLQNEEYALLLNLRKGETKDSLTELVLEGKEFLKHRCQIEMTCGISTRWKEVPEIANAYQEACTALKYRYLRGKGSVIEYEQVTVLPFVPLPSQENRVIHRISLYLAGGDSSTPRELICGVFAEYGMDKEVSLDTAECFKMEMISVMSRIVAQERQQDKLWESSMKSLLNAETQEEFAERLIEMVTEMQQMQKERNKNEHICVKAYEYIRDNCVDTNLSLVYLSERLKISPAYLSKLFREKYQISIPDYVNRVRCSRAAKELQEDRKTIQEIAFDCGFVSVNTFIRIFKKIEGVTPGEYRKINVNK